MEGPAGTEPIERLKLFSTRNRYSQALTSIGRFATMIATKLLLTCSKSHYLATP
jgi:hypothetical protein